MDRLRFNFVDGAAGAAAFIAISVGAPLFATETRFEQDLAAVVAWIGEAGGPEPPAWRALAEGRRVGPRRWEARAYAEMRGDALDKEQIERARVDPQAAARVESASGPGSLWLGATADFGAEAVDVAPGAIVHGPQVTDAIRRAKRPGVDAFPIPDAEAKALVRFRLGLFRGGGRCGRVSTDRKAKEPRCRCVEATARHRGGGAVAPPGALLAPR